MKQVSQRLRDGRIELRDVPAPDLDADSVLVRIGASLLSAGTERTKVQTGRQSLIGKARSRPDDVRQVIEKAHRDGVRETLATVRARLDQPSPLGYSAAGVALAVGERVRGVAPGDRVACAGANAGHAETDLVPGNLCVPLPSGVDFARGAFTTLGSIALHGVRQADVRLGERVAVIGLGLVGQIAAQLLRASGCTVVGIDLSPELIAHALDSGALHHGFTRDQLGSGELPASVSECDAVVIAASTAGNDPVELAARLCRDRGRVVVVGAVGMTLPRAPYYDKEIDLRLSRSYGPGRYDREYEERGLDYPIGYVRWTERRNMETFLDLIATGRVDVESLISRRIPIAQAPEAFEHLVEAAGSPLGIILEYDIEEPRETTAPVRQPGAGAPHQQTKATSLGVIGAGSFAQRVLIPAFKAADFELIAVASHTGLSASGAAERFGFHRAASASEILSDPELGIVAIATRHATHASLAQQALQAGLAVFVEKPPCLTEVELEQLREARDASARPFMVGFNRRHAPLVRTMRERCEGRTGPAEVLIRINAGALAPDHWLNDPLDGGGRLLGEGCHFVDLACWLMGDLPKQVSCVVGLEAGAPLIAAQRFSVALSFDDGSCATIAYMAAGQSRLGKEYIEMHVDGASTVLEDFRALRTYGRGRRRTIKGNGDKGHRAQLVGLREWLKGTGPGDLLDPLDTMSLTFDALRSAREGTTVHCGDPTARADLNGTQAGEPERRPA